MPTPVAHQDAEAPARPTSPVPGVPVKLLTVAEVMQRIKWHRSTIYRKVKQREFPQPVKLGTSTRWRSYEIDQFIEQLSAARGA